MRLTVGIFFLMCLYKIAAQVPGDLDTLYGADGNFCFPLDPASEFMPQNPDDEGSFQSAYEMDDGNIILGGMQGGNFMAMKITPQGRMIYGFGENGFADLSAVPYLGQLTSDGFKKIRQLPDGRFTGSTPRIVMITSEGVLDSTYHEDGIFDPPGIGYPECYDILDDNRIVFSYMYQNQINLILVRADGEPDSTFSLDGRQTIPVGIQTSIASVHFTNDQGIIFTSTTSEGCCINNYSMQIRKVTLIGSPFPGFGSLGVVTRGDASHHYQLQSSILDDQNRLIVGGVFSANAQTNPKVWFSRYLSDGTLDMTFGVNGDLIFTFPNAVVGPYATIDDMQWLPNGNILVTTDNGAFKITADGEWIESWGINGIHNYTYGSIVPMDDSRTLICSQYDNRPGVYAEIDMNNEFYYDLGFGSDGMCTFNSFRNMTLDLPYKYMKSDGGVIGIGGAYDSDIHTPDNFYRVVAASNSAGVQDTMFGTHGYYFMDVNEIVDIVAEQSDGRLILGGEFFGFDGSYLFRRLNADGSIDTSFGDGTGNAALWIDDDANYIIKDIHMLENDDFLVLLFWNDDNISILKFLSDGTPDLSFGDNGWVEIYLNMWYQENSNVPMYLKTDEYDRIILGGDLPLSSGQNAAYIIQRYLPNGEADFSFGQFGAIYMNTPGHYTDFVLLPEDKYLLGGFDANFMFSFMRMNSDGSIDTGFGTNGILGTGEVGKISKLLLHDNLLIVAIACDGDSDANGYAVHIDSYDLDIVLSDALGSGIRLYNNPNYCYEIMDLAIMPNGKLLVDGELSFYTTFGCEAPVPGIVETSATEICEEQDIVLTQVGGQLNDGTMWKWFAGSCEGVEIGTGNSITVSPSESTNYFVKGLGGCVDDSQCASVEVVLHAPVANVIIENDHFISIGIATSYQWLSCSDMTPVTGATNSVYYPGDFEQYALQAISGTCTDISDCVQITQICYPGDFDCDGIVGVTDLVIFNGQMFCTSNCFADLNGDGVVSIPDLISFFGLFGTIY